MGAYDAAPVSTYVAPHGSIGSDNIYCPATNLPTWGVSDGPAQLPVNCFNTWSVNTPNAGGVVSVERFGASAPAEVLLREYGFTVDNVCARAQALLG